jgi:hypothetical protein
MAIWKHFHDNSDESLKKKNGQRHKKAGAGINAAPACAGKNRTAA